MNTDHIIEAINNAWLSRYSGEPTTKINELIRRVYAMAEDRDDWMKLAKLRELSNDSNLCPRRRN